MKDKTLYIVGGCNGAGKTTASFTILPEILNCKEFVNADEIARGISPFQPENASFEAGRIMLRRINELLLLNENFAFETTLATRSYKNTVREARVLGYHVTLVFFWLHSFELAETRVNARVAEGGHSIPPEIIKRRFVRGLQNLFEIYLPIVNTAYIFDNSEGEYEMIAEKRNDGQLKLINNNRFALLKDCYDTIK